MIILLILWVVVIAIGAFLYANWRASRRILDGAFWQRWPESADVFTVTDYDGNGNVTHIDFDWKGGPWVYATREFLASIGVTVSPKFNIGPYAVCLVAYDPAFERYLLVANTFRGRLYADMFRIRAGMIYHGYEVLRWGVKHGWLSVPPPEGVSWRFSWRYVRFRLPFRRGAHNEHL